jgi:CHAD domain-containing protein
MIDQPSPTPPPVASYLLTCYNFMSMDLAYRRLAAQYIRRQAKQLAQQLDGLRAAEDIEFVHRARVATRRLRAALRMFRDCFHAKNVKRWRKAIRQMTKSLGNARDRDVQIEYLCGTLSALAAKQCFPGVARVLVQLERDRERFQREVVESVQAIEKTHVLDKMRRATKRTLRETESLPYCLPCREAFAQIRQHVLRQLNELLRYEASLADPNDRTHHHAMRIAAKRLRYTLEISRPMCPGRLDQAVETVKKLQTLLGDVHDCDVWLAHLDAFAAAERERILSLFGHPGRFHHLQPGIEHLRMDRQTHRERTFAELVACWSELKGHRFAEELAKAVEFADRNDDSATHQPQPRENEPGTEPGMSTQPPE